jgi:PAS domain-containing protein
MGGDYANECPGSVASQLEDLTLRFELALEALEAGVWEYHPRSGELLRDRRMRELFGLLDGNVQGLSYDDFKQSLHKDDLLLVENALSEALESGRRLNGQFRITKPTGGLCHLRVSGMP